MKVFPKFKKFLLKKPVIIFEGVLFFILFLFCIYNLSFNNKIYPGIFIAGIGVGGLTPSEATVKLERQVVVPSKVTISSPGSTFEIETSDFSLSYDYQKSSQVAFNLDRTGNILFDFAMRLMALNRKENLGLRLKLNEQELDKNITKIANSASVKPIYPSIKLEVLEIIIEQGSKGSEVKKEELRAQVGESLAFVKTQPITLPIKIVDPALTETELKGVRLRAEKIVGKNINLGFEFQNFLIKDLELLTFLNLKGGSDETVIAKKINDLSVLINRDPQDARFSFADGKVKEFAPSKDGIAVDSEKLKTEIITSLTKLESTEEKQLALDIPTNKTSAKIKTEEVNNFGIKELIGRGTSRFTGSIPSRVHNISIASTKINGSLVAPGETFSFDNAVGDVSAYTGYKQAYIIKDGKTVLGDGGGLCQVSTTFFRAALNAGLPIVERRAHAYRVGYYEQDSLPGLDATVYVPTTDLKVKNDTPGYVLIQTIPDLKNYTLAFEIYGTSDGRVSNVSKPIISNVTPPAPDLYQDDPTLKAGVIKQVEHRANGAKVTFAYTVTRDGEKIYEKNFISNYQPWQAVYLRGTAPAL